MKHYFFKPSGDIIYALASHNTIDNQSIIRLQWLLGEAALLNGEELDRELKGVFKGPKINMITPFSTTSVEICKAMGVNDVFRIEKFVKFRENDLLDKMLETLYKDLKEIDLSKEQTPEGILHINNIEEYNTKEGLALSKEEIIYLNELSARLDNEVKRGEKKGLTDTELFGYSQINSEHCRHKIFNAEFIINGVKKPKSLFALIKDTAKANPNNLVSAYKDNVAFIKGSKIMSFSSEHSSLPSLYKLNGRDTVLALKAETHNFPTTVEPFNGAATGSGGEIRDRMAGGLGSLPLAGTAVYMTPNPRLREDLDRDIPNSFKEREWLYQTPLEILIKASNGASDFGNKFGQPLINGSLFTFELDKSDDNIRYSYDKVIMMAGGVGYAFKEDAIKKTPQKGDKVVLVGGDNYRIGMGGGAVSSVNTGGVESSIELNAIQRSNPEMQKRAYNVIRALVESGDNPIISIHDHGAGGHINCLTELVEEVGGEFLLKDFPVGDPSLSAKEIICNESQERIGFVVKEADLERVRAVAKRENSPIFVVGECKGDNKIVFIASNGEKAVDLDIKDFIGNSPSLRVEDNDKPLTLKPLSYNEYDLLEHISNVLKLEGVACKDWLTNKVDRSVSGLVALQQTTGEIQLPLNNVGVMTLDYLSNKGIATAIGHNSAVGLISPAAGSRMAIAESLTNLMWVNLKDGLKDVSLSANWMWACKNEGESAKLYEAVESASEFAIALGVNIPTGKDSLSMTQQYPNNEKVVAPGTVIITAVGEVNDIRKSVSPTLKKDSSLPLLYIGFTKENRELGGSAFAQTINQLGDKCVDILDIDYFKRCFNAVQELIEKEVITAGHDISSGGVITTLLEMCFSNKGWGLDVNFTDLKEKSLINLLFSEVPGAIIQVNNLEKALKILESFSVETSTIGYVREGNEISIKNDDVRFHLGVSELRDVWFSTSYLLDKEQTPKDLAKKRFDNYKEQPLNFVFPDRWEARLQELDLMPVRYHNTGFRAAILRDKGSNSEREMANALFLAGFDVVDVHVSDLTSGRIDLSSFNLLAAVGGFSNGDVLGSAKGWAAALKYNEKANKSLADFFAREDTLSIGVCNGCQLFMELGLLFPTHKLKPIMKHNDSGKFESAFVSVDIVKNNSVMLSSLEGTKLGIWVSHGEGKFSLPQLEEAYNIPVKYSYKEYPASPNGSDYNAAAVCSDNGRHLAIMPHPERSLLSWNWAYNIKSNNISSAEITPWIEAFVNAKEWIKKIKEV